MLIGGYRSTAHITGAERGLERPKNAYARIVGAIVCKLVEWLTAWA